MKFSSEHIQPMNLGDLFRQSIKLGKQIYFLSLPSNFLILCAISSLAYLFYSYALSLGVEDAALSTVTIFNNLLFLSVMGANIFYLLLQRSQRKTLHVTKNALINTLRITPTIIVATLLYAISVSMGLVLLVIPGLLLLGFFGLFAQVITFEDEGIITSLLRSWELVKGSLGKVFLSLFSILLLTNAITILLALLADSYFNTDQFLFNVLFDLLVYIFIMPFIGAFLALLYFDVRASQEAFDFIELKRSSTY